MHRAKLALLLKVWCNANAPSPVGLRSLVSVRRLDLEIVYVSISLLSSLLQPLPGRHFWHGGPTPLGALRGVTAEQARWRPAPKRKSLWELALHIAYWNYAVRSTGRIS